MKKCPKCGTILDDSKSKCYMCGASIGVGGPVSFLDNIDNDIGATVANSQDNVFNNGEDIEVLNLNEVSNDDNRQTFVSHSSSTRDYYSSEINQLNLGAIDDYNPFAQENNSNNVNNQMQQSMGQQVPQLQDANDLQPVQTPPNPQKEKKKINWGKNLKTENGEFAVGGMRITKPMIFNAICFVIFLGLIIFAYFKFIRKPSNSNVYVGGLIYSIDSDFINISNDPSSKSYRYNNCEVRVSYGVPSGDDPLDKYFEGVKDSLSSEKDAQFKRDSFNLNGNTWQTLEVQFFVNDRMNENGYEIQTKYKYSSIVFKANIYHISYYNPDFDTKCAEKYAAFQDTLKFE